MRTRSTVAVTLAALGLAGCQSSSPRGGGESKGEGFRVVVPADVVVKQGEVRSVSVSVDRDEYFKRDVRLEVRPTRGISAEPSRTLVRASDKGDVSVRVAADKDAALGEYRVYVKGTPESGATTSAEFKVKVVAP